MLWIDDIWGLSTVIPLLSVSDKEKDFVTSSPLEYSKVSTSKISQIFFTENLIVEVPTNGNVLRQKDAG